MPRGPEHDLQEAAIDLLRRHHFLVAHFRPARTEQGWRTAVGADGEGFFDLVAMRPGAPVIVIEVKPATGKLRPDQRDWMSAATGADGVIYTLLAPASWRMFEKGLDALDKTYPIEDGWPAQLGLRGFRHEMRKNKDRMLAALANGEQVGPPTVTTTMVWERNEPVKIGKTVYLYAGHGSDGSICTYGPVVWDGSRSKWVGRPTGKAPGYTCWPAAKVKRKVEK